MRNTLAKMMHLERLADDAHVRAVARKTEGGFRTDQQTHELRQWGVKTIDMLQTQQAAEAMLCNLRARYQHHLRKGKK